MPPQQHYSPAYHGFVALPPRLAQRIRSSSALIGSLSIGLSVIIGIVIVAVGHQLPTSTWATMAIAIWMGALSAFFHLFSGVTLATGPTHVKNGYLNLTSASKARRLLVIFLGGTVFPTMISIFFFTGAVEASVEASGDPLYRQLHGQLVGYTPSIIGYLILLGAPLLLSTLNMIIGWRLLRPSPGLVHKYSSGPHNPPPHR
ncbi:hypothetical protein [Saccharopolyspora sp. 5N708]|uniref:hypothetical protein n=1 Tax=Saccharopolyspora sp. 5N708 TaxID=3457424 RepID=UPI003FD541C6